VLLNHNISSTSTIWSKFMTAMYRFGRDRSDVILRLELPMTYGADLDIPVQVGALSDKSLDSQSFLDASEIIREYNPDDAE
jgi:hypothetical protein